MFTTLLAGSGILATVLAFSFFGGLFMNKSSHRLLLHPASIALPGLIPNRAGCVIIARADSAYAYGLKKNEAEALLDHLEANRLEHCEVTYQEKTGFAVRGVPG